MVDAALGRAGHRSARYTSPHLIDLVRTLRRRRQTGGRRGAAQRRRRRARGDRAAPRRGRARRPRRRSSRSRPPWRSSCFAGRASRSRSSRSASAAGSTRPTSSSPSSSAITSIDFDHQQYLGSTLGEIAAEKAGIIKPGVPVIVGDVGPEAWDVIARVAGERGAELIRARDGVDVAPPGAGRRRRQPVPAADACPGLRHRQARASRRASGRQRDRRGAAARNARRPRRGRPAGGRRRRPRAGVVAGPARAADAVRRPRADPRCRAQPGRRGGAGVLSHERRRDDAGRSCSLPCATRMRAGCCRCCCRPSIESSSRGPPTRARPIRTRWPPRSRAIAPVNRRRRRRLSRRGARRCVADLVARRRGGIDIPARRHHEGDRRVIPFDRLARH